MRRYSNDVGADRMSTPVRNMVGHRILLAHESKRRRPSLIKKKK